MVQNADVLVGRRHSRHNVVAIDEAKKRLAIAHSHEFLEVPFADGGLTVGVDMRDAEPLIPSGCGNGCERSSQAVSG